MPLEPEDFALFADTINRVSRCEIAGEVISLAWTMRNRLNELRGLDGDGTPHLLAIRVCDEVLVDVGIGHNGTHPVVQHRPCLVVASNSRTTAKRDLVEAYVRMVWEGLLPDPTQGASRVQHHEHKSRLDRAWEPTALIGALLFFRRNAGQGGFFLPS
jgi:hypothetical protein